MEKAKRRSCGRSGDMVLLPLTLAIAGFSLFPGDNKALAPLAVLAQHSAWTIHLSALLGRAIGWLEMLAAATPILSLAIPRLAASAHDRCTDSVADQHRSLTAVLVE